MTAHRWGVFAFSLIAAPLQARQSPPAVPPAASAAIERATLLWDAGDYPAALEGIAALLRTPQPEAVLRPLALLTGEWYTTRPLADDGRNVRISADGQYGAWESGTGSEAMVTVVRLGDGAELARVPGRNLSFAPDGHAAAFIQVGTTPELTAARERQAAAAAARDQGAARAAGQEVSRLELAASVVTVLDLRTGETTPIRGIALRQPTVTWGADSYSLWVVTAPAEGAGTAILEIAQDGSTRTFATPGEAASEPELAHGGLWLVHAVGNNTIAVRGIVTGSDRRFTGRAMQLAADGSALVALSSEAGKNRVWVLPLDQEEATPITVLETPLRVENPAISPDGKRVVFSMMYEDDWELAVAEVGGGEVRRLTREIQHDRLPQFLTADQVLSVMGEGRHRRSYLYDVSTGERTRLFHNNTIRTIAPEYEWVASADGATLLVVADRDGDTVSPERGVYLMDLRRPVTQDELLARVEGNLAGERALRTLAQAIYKPIAPLVQGLVDSVSTPRLYGYQKALSEFDSRHITRPGNNQAGAWLAETFLSFGYAPEYQWFQPPALRASGGQTANVFATLTGTTHPDVVYVVGGHYDSVVSGPGADDDATGIAVLLEAARVLAGHPLPATVIFAAFTGEEAGLLGATEFARRAVADSLDVRGGLNNDMLGWSNDYRLDNTIRYSNPGIRDVEHAAALEFSKLITYDSRYYQSTDADPMFRAWGNVIGGIGSYPVLGNPNYHQATDRLPTINQSLVTETAKATVAALVYLASAPSPVRGLAIRRQAGGGVVTWEAGPEKDIASYVVTWGPPNGPARGTVTVRGTSSTIGVLPEGTIVSVRAVNARGLVGWDWSRAVAPPVIEE